MSNKEETIRNIALVGHQSSGKTTLAESMAYRCNVIARKGTVESKNTISDYLPDEQKRCTSLSTAVIPLTYNNHKINVLDIPGNDDFIFELQGISKIIKGAILVVDASKGVQIGTIKNFHSLKKKKVPMIIFVNKMDKENIDFNALAKELEEKLSKACVPFTYPIGEIDGFVSTINEKAYLFDDKDCHEDPTHNEDRAEVNSIHEKIEEIVAGTDDNLLEKYFSGEQLTIDEIRGGLRTATLNSELYPVIVGSATKDLNTVTLLDSVIDFLPSPVDLDKMKATDESGKEIELECNSDDKTVLSVFKNSYNTYQGLISIFKVISGTIHLGDELICPNNSRKYRVSTLFTVTGDKLTPVTEISAGDIGAVTKLDEIRLSYTLSSPDRVVKIAPVHYPTATYSRGVVPATKNDSDKLFPALEKLQFEDPTIHYEKNQFTNQILVGSLSSSHLQYILDKVKDTSKINFTLEKPKIVYKETITQMGDSEGRYVKQSGGSGAYGVVNMSFEPSDHCEFASTVFGGHIDKGYFPAVEKGFNEAIQHGGLIGAPVINVKATLTDGKQHPVDSNEMAFRNAAIDAFKKAYPKCKPILLEPYDKISINVDNDYLGSILSDLSKRRARILSTDEGGDGTLNIQAVVPEAEILEYANELKSITKGTGFFNLQFEDYERVPDALVDQVVKENTKL